MHSKFGIGLESTDGRLQQVTKEEEGDKLNSSADVVIAVKNDAVFVVKKWRINQAIRV